MHTMLAKAWSMAGTVTEIQCKELTTACAAASSSGAKALPVQDCYSRVTKQATANDIGNNHHSFYAMYACAHSLFPYLVLAGT